MSRAALILRAAATAALILVAGLYAGTILAHISYAAGGADSSGYLNEARLIAAGRVGVFVEPVESLKVDWEWIHVFTPVGFTWGRPGSGEIGPGYPPGLPAHLALASKLGGWSVAPFFVSPLAAFGCGILMFLLGRELGLERWLSLAASAMLLFLPQLIAHAIQPVSDVLATFWALLAMWLALRANRSPESWRLYAAAGVAFGIGVTVRPTNVFLAVPLALAARMRIRALVAIAAAALPFGLAILWWQSAVYGSALRTGYGNAFTLLSMRTFAECARIFVHWMSTISTVLVFPGGLLVLFHRKLDVWIRVTLAAWFTVFFFVYCLWSPYPDWWSARFLLPGTAGLILGTLLLVQWLWSAPNERRFALVAKAASIAIVAWLVIHPFRLSREWRALNASEMNYPRAVRWAERQMPANSRIISGTLSGAFFYYGNHFSVRPDQLDDAMFRKLRENAGPSTLWYAVLDPNEVKEVKKRFAGNWTLINSFADLTLWRFDS